jgi:hypothetical protein
MKLRKMLYPAAYIVLIPVIIGYMFVTGIMSMYEWLIGNDDNYYDNDVMR